MCDSFYIKNLKSSAAKFQGLHYAKHFPLCRKLFLQLNKRCGGYAWLKVHISGQQGGEVRMGAL